MSLFKGTRITWLGHSTVLIQTAKDTNLLIDPFIAQNPKYPKDYVLPEKIDYVFLTHGHGDHISDAVPVATKHGSTVVAIYELSAYIAGKGVSNTMGMNLGGTVQLKDVAATMVEATHSAAAQDEQGTHYVGVATGFVLAIDGGPVLYHSGDTNVFGDMKLPGSIILRLQCSRLAAFTPWGQRKPHSPSSCCSQRWFYRYTLGHSRH